MKCYTICKYREEKIINNFYDEQKRRFTNEIENVTKNQPGSEEKMNNASRRATKKIGFR